MAHQVGDSDTPKDITDLAGQVDSVNRRIACSNQVLKSNSFEYRVALHASAAHHIKMIRQRDFTPARCYSREQSPLFVQLLYSFIS